MCTPPESSTGVFGWLGRDWFWSNYVLPWGPCEPNWRGGGSGDHWRHQAAGGGSERGITQQWGKDTTGPSLSPLECFSIPVSPNGPRLSPTIVYSGVTRQLPTLHLARNGPEGGVSDSTTRSEVFGCVKHLHIIAHWWNVCEFRQQWQTAGAKAEERTFVAFRGPSPTCTRAHSMQTIEP